MLSTVNANRFINMGAIPLAIVAYAVFLWIDDHNVQRQPWYHEIKVHIQNIKNIGRVDGLVFGGSNAVYSLSAESLNYFTGLTWYNASVAAETDNTKRHKNFIRDLSARIDRTKVRYIVYSSISPSVSGRIAKSKADDSRKYIQDLAIKPHQSVLQYIRHRNWQWQSPPRRNSYGDLVFDEMVNCDFKENHAAREPETVREDIDIAVDFLVDMTTFFTSVFPNASIQIVSPSFYYGGLSFDDAIYKQALRTKFYGFLLEKYSTKNKVKIIFQPPFPSIAQVCDTVSHANEDGRLWRTRNLIELMSEAITR